MIPNPMYANTEKWRKTKRGLVTNLYHKMKGRNVVEFELEYLHEFAACQKFDRLYQEWKASNYKKEKKPSIDRISNKKGYAKGNIQWLTWGENRHKQNMERRKRKPKVAQIKDGKVVAIHNSQRDAVLSTGISQSNISSVLSGKRKVAAGFQWEYIYQHPELLTT